MDALIKTLSVLPLSDIVPIIKKDIGLDRAFRQYVSSGYYIADTSGGVDETLLPDLDTALLPPVPEEGYPKAYYTVLELYSYGLIDTLPVQVENMVHEIIDVMTYRKPIRNSILSLDRRIALKLAAMSRLSEKLRDDKEFILSVIGEDTSAYNYISDRLKQDRDVILAGVRSNIHILHYAPVEFKDDREIIFTAVQHNPSAIQYASDRLKQDKSINYGRYPMPRVLQFSPNRLRENNVKASAAITLDDKVDVVLELINGEADISYSL